MKKPSYMGKLLNVNECKLRNKRLSYSKIRYLTTPSAWVVSATHEF